MTTVQGTLTAATNRLWRRLKGFCCYRRRWGLSYAVMDVLVGIETLLAVAQRVVVVVVVGSIAMALAPIKQCT